MTKQKDADLASFLLKLCNIKFWRWENLTDLIYKKEGAIAQIVLNRPESLNAFSVEMLNLWVEALKDASKDDEIRVITVSGNGRAFCAGGDIKAMARGEGFLAGYHKEQEEVEVISRKNSLWKLVHRVAFTLQEVDKPVIASINGAATGAGLDMALWCDLRIAAKSAIFSESYIKLSLIPGDGGAYLLPRLVGVAKALELLWTGETFDADKAAEFGLVNKVVPDEKLVQVTKEFAEKLSEKSPLAIAMIKRAVYQGVNCDIRQALDYISSQMAIITQTKDHQEAIKSFVEKRKPEYNGN